METFIMIDTLGAIHAHIKATTPKEAKSIYTEDFACGLKKYICNIMFAVTEQQIKSLKL